MKTDELERVMRTALAGVAPDLEFDELDPETPIRDQADFDSMDTLNFAIALSRALGIDIPESDYPHLASLAECRRYLAMRTG
ncbi:acyl carrier protein [Thioalkalivibrio sp. XN8]|uniref:acyl carrier protein n=1 Tax=Thioalkalivibrio sp. XN8 TaxID=2712863 RepID=UPI0013EE3831|nr:acyl carrier protein [Thioalkalivibrio sp. XN8]NGP53383.1 acyl carrier protein [Thioalkalivibrio sp. XN8]